MKKLRNAVRRLRIQRGDVIIAHPSLREQFHDLRVPQIDWVVPIIWTVNTKDIRTMGIERLEKILADMKKTEEVKK